MSDPHRSAGGESSSTGVTGVQALLALAGGLVILGALLEVAIAAVGGVLIFVTVSGVIVVGDVLAGDPAASASDANPAVTTEPTEIAGVVIVTAMFVGGAFVVGLRALSMLGALVLLAVGGVLILSWTLDSEAVASDR